MKSLFLFGRRLIFTVASDWCQKLLYEKHSLNFVTVMLQICSAHIDCGGEIYFVSVFRVVPCFYNSMSGYKFTKIPENLFPRSISCDKAS